MADPSSIRVLLHVTNHPDDVDALGDGREEGPIGLIPAVEVERVVEMVRRYADDWDFLGSEWRLAGDPPAFELLLSFRRGRQMREREGARDRAVDAAVSR
ncbi:MAG TPA: hypothetical protein VFH78_06560 [Candidatus Thermoplasmatota archaeon]|nr:hypothetical protein [Candidatus Thermoplasmatota archaeon]